MRSTILSALATLAVAAAPAAIAKPQLLGEFGAWKAFKSEDGGGLVCYALSQPQSTAPKNVKRDPIFVIISNFPSRQVKGEPSLVIGYPFKEGSKATASVGGANFTFETLNQDTEGGGWIADPGTEQQFVAALRDGSSLTVKGTSRRGTNTTDQYSLSGVSQAIDRVNQECP